MSVQLRAVGFCSGWLSLQRFDESPYKGPWPFAYPHPYKVATQTLQPASLVALENVGDFCFHMGCSELVQVKGTLGRETSAGEHGDCLQTTIKPSTSPAIGAG